MFKIGLGTDEDEPFKACSTWGFLNGCIRRHVHFVQFSAFTEVGAPLGAPLPLQSYSGFCTVFGSDRIGPVWTMPFLA